MDLLLSTPAGKGLLETPAELQVKLFPDGESYLRVLVPVKGKNVLLAHRCYPEPDRGLMQLFLAVAQLKEMGAKKISCFVPYLPYARQDKRFLEGEALSAYSVCRLLKLSGCSELVALDCHFLKKEGRSKQAGLSIRNYSLARQLVAYFKGKASDPLVVSPDVGANYMVGDQGKAMKKVRGEYSQGENAFREVAELKADFDARGRDVILIDDMISTGGTMVRAVETLKKAGARRVFCAATHGLFLNNSLERLKAAGAAEIVVSDSIPSPASKVRASQVLQ